MKIEPIKGPQFVNSSADAPSIGRPGALSPQAQSARERAIAILTGQQPSASVQNPSQVSAEEMVGVQQTQGQNNTTETPAATSPKPSAPAVEEQQQPLSPQFAVLARKEKALRAEIQKLNAERAAFKAERAAAVPTPPVSTFDESKYIPKDRLLNDPVAVFEETGLSGEELAQRILNYKQVDPAVASHIAKLEAKLAKLEATQDETRKTIESSQNTAYEQAIAAIKYEAEELINSDPEFQTIKSTGQTDEVVNLIKEVHAKGLPGKYKAGTLLTVEAAARLVEDELVNQWVEQYEKLSQLEKIKARLSRDKQQVAKPSTSQGTQAQPASATTQNTTRTLTNSMPNGAKMSARDRAIAVFKGELKN